MVARATASNVRTAVQSPSVKTKSKARAYTIGCKLPLGLTCWIRAPFDQIEGT